MKRWTVLNKRTGEMATVSAYNGVEACRELEWSYMSCMWVQKPSVKGWLPIKRYKTGVPQENDAGNKI